MNKERTGKCLQVELLEHVDDVSFRELFGRIRVVFIYKIRSVLSYCLNE